MDLDPDKLVNSMGDAAVQAEILKKFREANPPPAPPAGQAPEGAGGPPGVTDTAGGGGGNIGIGTAPQPGEQGFSANTNQSPG